MKKLILQLLLTATVLQSLCAQQDKPDETRRRNLRYVTRQYRKNLQEFKDDADVLVLRGLVARRRDRRVELTAEATGLAAADPVEFILVGEGSLKDYEAIAVSFAKPGGVHRALEFIGMTPGRPANSNPRGIPSWPKGERVIGFAEPAKAGDSGSKVRLEKLLMNSRTETTMAEDGFVFVGSQLVSSSSDPGEQVYAADYQAPHSIISTYNEPLTVLDVPRQAPKDEVYKIITPNPDLLYEQGQLLTVSLEPEYKDGTRRVTDLTLAVEPAAGETDTKMGVRFQLSDADGGVRTDSDGLTPVLAEFGELTKAGKDPFVQVVMARALPLKTVRAVAKLLESIDKDAGIRVEPPPEGHLYYRAFLPVEEWRDREKRLSQPVELHLEKDGGQVKGQLKLIETKWPEDREATKPKLIVTEQPVASPQALADAVSARSLQRKPLVIYAPANLLYGDLLTFVRPVLESNPTVFVFLETPPE